MRVKGEPTRVTSISLVRVYTCFHRLLRSERIVEKFLPDI